MAKASTLSTQQTELEADLELALKRIDSEIYRAFHLKQSAKSVTTNGNKS